MVDFTKKLIATRSRTGDTAPARLLYQRFTGTYAVLVNPGTKDELILTFDNDGLSATLDYKLSNPPRTVERRLWIDGLHAVGEGNQSRSFARCENRMVMTPFKLDKDSILIHDDGDNHLKLVIDADTGKILEVSLLP